MLQYLLKRSKSKPRDFLELSFKKSALIAVSGIYLIVFSIVVGMFVLFISAFTDTAGDLSTVLSLFEIPLVAGFGIVFVSLTLYLSDLFEDMSRIDPHREAHGSDFLLGVVFMFFGYYGMSLGHESIPEIEANLLSTEYLYGAFIYLIISGWYAMVSGVFINGVTRILIHILDIRGLFASTWRDIRETYESIKLSKWFRIWGVVNEYRTRRGLSLIEAICEIFFSGLAMIEPVDPSDHDEIRDRVADADKTQLNPHLKSQTENWYGTFVYVAAATPILAVFSWGYLVENSTHPIREIGVILLLISVTIGYLTVPSYVKDVAYLYEESSGYSSYWRAIIVVLLIAPLFSLVVVSPFYSWTATFEAVLVILQGLILLVFLRHLVLRQRSG